MGEKEGKGGEEKQKKQESGPTTVVLKVDFHCEGCAQKVKRSIKRVDGVESVTADMASNKLTVVGKVDPVKLKEMVVEKTGKKVEIISPSNNAGVKLKDGSGDAKKQGAAAANDGGGDKEVKMPAEEKKAKSPQSSTVVFKIPLHCEGCIQSIKKKIYKVKGVEAVLIDAGKDLVTVKGMIDPKTLPAILRDKLKRGVEVILAKKSENAGGEKKESGDGGSGKKEGGDGEKKKDGGGGEKKKEGGGGTDSVKEAGKAVEVNKMEHYGVPYGYQVQIAHAPQIFSDENPNACSIM